MPACTLPGIADSVGDRREVIEVATTVVVAAALELSFKNASCLSRRVSTVQKE